jgi:hypothetical protein
MRLTRTDFDARVKVSSGPRPVVLAFGICAFRSTTDDAIKLASDLLDAVEEVRRGGGE